MCTVLLRIDPTSAWPVVLGAVRDEFLERPWDPPAAHWPGSWATFVGGRDRTAGGTWLAVDPSPDRPAVAALLNGPRRDPLPDDGIRPTRGVLALRALAGEGLPEGDELEPYDRFHLLVATTDRQELFSWNGEGLTHRELDHGDHIVVNRGLDTVDDPLVPHFAPLLATTDDPELDAGDWGGWPWLLAGDGLPGDDERALVVAKEIEGHAYGSTSGSLVALGRADGLRYEFTATPADLRSWRPVPVT